MGRATPFKDAPKISHHYSLVSNCAGNLCKSLQDSLDFFFFFSPNMLASSSPSPSSSCVNKGYSIQSGRGFERQEQ
eukprot:1657970-Amphidinium_carterae.1